MGNAKIDPAVSLKPIKILTPIKPAVIDYVGKEMPKLIVIDLDGGRGAHSVSGWISSRRLDCPIGSADFTIDTPNDASREP